MFIPVVCFVSGLLAMGRTKPVTKVHKIQCLGPKSGIVYQVEDFREIGVVVVRAPNNQAIAQFLRAAAREPGKPGLIYQHGQGAPQLLAAIRSDFGVEAAKPQAAKEKSA
jgi:hypothetical protein